MSRHPVILEITNRELRAVQILKSFGDIETGNPQILRFTQADDEIRAALIVEFLKKNYPQTEGVYFNIPAEAQYLRDFEVPFKALSKIKEVIPFELEARLPCELDEVVHDFSIRHLPGETIDSSVSHVTVCAAKIEALMPWVQLFRSASIPILGIYSLSAALSSSRKWSEENSFLQLHVSSAYSFLNIIEEKQVVFMRVIPVGYDMAVYRLAKKWKKSLEESEEIFHNIPPQANLPGPAFYKKYFDITQAQAKIFATTIDEFADNLTKEVHLSMNVAGIDESAELPLVLSTDLNEAAIIENLMRGRIDNPIRIAPYEKTSIPEPAYFLAQAQAHSTSKDIHWNLLKGPLKKAAGIGSSGKRWLVPALLSVGTLFFAIALFLQYNHLKKEIAKSVKFNQALFERMFHRKPKKLGSLSYQAKMLIKKEKEKTEIYREFLDRPAFTALLVQVNRAIKVDPNMMIQQITYNGSELNMAGNTDSFASIAKVKQELTKIKDCHESGFKNQKQAPGKNGGSIVKFTLFCSIREKS